ncbi:MAG: hypothetical protein QOJ76_3296 [Acidobacteriota bacterium]|nr:hypothetical protein [Acidobacteriota bacterium]
MTKHDCGTVRDVPRTGRRASETQEAERGRPPRRKWICSILLRMALIRASTSRPAPAAVTAAAAAVRDRAPAAAQAPTNWVAIVRAARVQAAAARNKELRRCLNPKCSVPISSARRRRRALVIAAALTARDAAQVRARVWMSLSSSAPAAPTEIRVAGDKDRRAPCRRVGFVTGNPDDFDICCGG